jgi:hypothetical protein
MHIRTNPPATYPAFAIAAFFIAVPAVIFYVTFFRHLENAPINDDYPALLHFSNHLMALPHLSEKIYYILISQHNEYKHFLEHVLFWIQLELSGHIDFTVLCILGDSFVLGLALLLWKMFLPCHNLATRLTLFIPISWLLFQLQYAQADLRLDRYRQSVAYKLPYAPVAKSSLFVRDGSSVVVFSGDGCLG